MAGYLIAETTREEREKIVAESLGNIEANCDGCICLLYTSPSPRDTR